MLDDTIAAIATPPGVGALAVVRISGPEALVVAGRCFRRAGRGVPLAEVPSHTLHYGWVRRDGEVVDEVLLSVMRAPRTFTREDVVEISCHGGALTTRAVLDAVLAAGARSAEPGEFTRRAFCNGRIDLAQAEAVADLIEARTGLALAAARDQLRGHLSRRIEGLRDGLMDVLGHLEAYIDFPDEDIDPETGERFLARMRVVLEAMDELLARSRDARWIRDGVRVAIVGRPNVGKSSLLNRLLGDDRAIVSDIAGTTRDTVEEAMDVHGLLVRFADTAGLRAAADEIEEEGIRRSRRSMERADLVLLVVDGSEPWCGADSEFLREVGGRRCLVVRNKSDRGTRADLPDEIGALDVVEVSCVTGAGVEALCRAIRDRVLGADGSAEAHDRMVNARHQDALRRGREALARALEALEAGLAPEFVSLDLRMAADAVGEIVGKTSTENLLDVIFSRFCIGK